VLFFTFQNHLSVSGSQGAKSNDGGIFVSSPPKGGKLNNKTTKGRLTRYLVLVSTATNLFFYLLVITILNS
jgi:hypothetical protein